MSYLLKIQPIHIQKALGTTPELAEKFYRPLLVSMERSAIHTRPRVSAFLAQGGHETGGLRQLSENLNYSAKRLLEVFPNKFTPEQAQAYAWNPVAIANKVYGGRYGNGPESSGDGWKYRGRGFMHTTFKANYYATGEALDFDFLFNPDAMTLPGAASMSAAWFWQSNGLNGLADAGGYLSVSIKINGRNKATGLPNGWEGRKKYYAMALEALPE